MRAEKTKKMIGGIAKFAPWKDEAALLSGVGKGLGQAGNQWACSGVRRIRRSGSISAKDGRVSQTMKNP